MSAGGVQWRRGSRPLSRVVLAAGGLVWYALVTSAAGVYASTGDSYPGVLTAVAEPVGYFTAPGRRLRLSVGWSTSSSPHDRNARGVIDDRRSAATSWWSGLGAWTLAATAMVVVQAASDAVHR